jgi:alkylhydroperoxidase/carboxymuconolactone decarboxylase family protein YurZ
MEAEKLGRQKGETAMGTVHPGIDSASTTGKLHSQDRPQARLQDLIPIVMVIVGGCEPCAEKMVNRALSEGSSWEDVDKTLRIVANMQKLDCFAKAVGPEVVARMEKPLAAGRRTLQAISTRAAA